MPNIVYFSHSYRQPDARVVDYFGRALEVEELTPSLDPPSDGINAAKLERHLNYCDAMVAVLTEREGGVSSHILYEITLALRARKPLIVFVEDTIPSGVLPSRILQQRFSRRGFLRQTREHRQALRLLRSYLGEVAPPRYQPSAIRRSCLIMLDPNTRVVSSDELVDFVSADCRYDVVVLDEAPPAIRENQAWWEAVLAVDVVLAIHSAMPDPRIAYTLGVLRGALRPVIRLTEDSHYPFDLDVPRQYQPVVVDSKWVDVKTTMVSQFKIFEQDFLDLADQESVSRYSEQLLELGGHYYASTRENVTEVVMGDKYDVRGQVGAVGPNSHVHDVNFNQVWAESSERVDLKELAAELVLLRSATREQASTPEDDVAVAELGQAQKAAEEGDGPKTMTHLAMAGRWALTVAQGIGIGGAVGAIKIALGV